MNKPMNKPAKTDQSAEASGTLRLLDPARVHFAKHGIALKAMLAGEAAAHENVFVLRLFPLSHPDRYWSIRDEDDKELGVICDPALFEPEQRELLEESLKRRYLLSAINRILEIRERFETLDWLAETERGLHWFTTRQLRDNILQPSANRYIITDVEGNRFDIPDVSRLPPASQALLFRHL